MHALQLLNAHFVLSSEEDTNEHDTAISNTEATNNEISVTIILNDANVQAPKGQPNSELEEYFKSLIASLKHAEYRSQYPQNKDDIVQNTSQNVESKREADESEENAEADTETSQLSDHSGGHSEKSMPELPGVFEDTAVTKVGYFHLIFEEHRVVIANDAPSESVYFGNEALNGLAPETYKELLEIFPTLSENSNLHTNRSTSLLSNAKHRRLIYRYARNNTNLS